MYFNCFDGSKIVVRVTGFKDGIVYGDSEKGSHWCKNEKAEPIPLTPEILEQNGFVLKEEEVGMYGVEIAPHYTRDDLPFEVFCDGEPFAVWFKDPVNIKYVHQLQHAMRFCGIEKEIIVKEG